MKINQATDYAFRVVLFLAGRQPDEVVDARQIAEKENIPIRFLLKTVRLLAATGIVKSYRGIKGGYRLGRLAKDITLKDVLEAVEGPVKINRCLMDSSECSKDATRWCPIHQALKNVQDATNEELDKYNFADLVKNINNREEC